MTIGRVGLAPAAKASRADGSAYPLYLLALLWLVNVFNYLDRFALAVLMPSIKRDLSLSDGQLGLLVGFAFSVFYAVCGIPIARLADRGVRKDIIALGLTLWSVMTALCGAAQNFWHLFLARVGVGAGEACCMPPGQSLICDYIPPKRRSAALAFHNSGLFIGMMLSMALAGWLGEAIGWRLAFVALGLPGVLLAVVVWATIREPVRGVLDAPSDAAAAPDGFWRTARILARNRVYAFIVGYYVLNSFAQYGLNQWWPSFYLRTHQLSPAEIGWPLGIAVGLGSGAGLLLGGLLSSFSGSGSPRPPLYLGGLFTLLALPTAVAALFVASPTTSILLVGATNLLWSVAVGPVLGTLYNATPPTMRATAGALPLFFSAILGFGLGPLVVGLLSDMLAGSHGDGALRLAMIAPIAILPLMGAVVCAAAYNIPSQNA